MVPRAAWPFAAVVAMGAIYFAYPMLAPSTYDKNVPEEKTVAGDTKSREVAEEKKVIPEPRKKYLPTPEPLKAIYMSQCVVGTPNFREDLVTLIDATEINAVVIDIKDYTGKISFDTDNPVLASSVSDACGAGDMESFLDYLREKNIYTIGRITVFQDPYYTVNHPETAVKRASDPNALWSDHKGLHFIDVGAKPYWEYVIELSKEARKIGFDELNYDYIRFPSDGPMSDIYFPYSNGKEKPVALEEFFKYLHDHMKDREAFPESEPLPVISADLFGMTTTNTDDLNIGQQLERAMPYFDYIAPMVYPSHYPKNFNGWSNPNLYPAELIKFVMSAAVVRTIATESVIPTFGAQKIMTTEVVTPAASGTPAVTREVWTGKYKKEAYSKLKMRPWLQDFDYGGNYDVAEVRGQIQATYDAGLTSWMLWAPSNRYTRGALKDE